MYNIAIYNVASFFNRSVVLTSRSGVDDRQIKPIALLLCVRGPVHVTTVVTIKIYEISTI
jgi:hypothetical protein